MMICSKCGTEVENAVFCPNCGGKMEEKTTEAIANNTENSKETESNVSAQKNGAMDFLMKNKFIFVIAGAVVAFFAIAMIIVLFAIFHKPTVKLDKYVDVAFEGYDSVGYATYTINREDFLKKYSGKIKLNKKNYVSYLSMVYGMWYSPDMIKEEIKYMSDDDIAELYLSMVSGSLDNTNELSNGDVVVLTLDVSDEIEKLFKCKTKYTEEREFTVTGLEPVAYYDPFDTVDVIFSGTAPYGSATVDRMYSDENNYISYTFDRSEGLSNGDEIVLTAKLTGSESTFVDRFQKLPNPTEKTYKVEGLLSYIQSSNDIPNDLLNQMQAQSEDTFRSYVARDWDDTVSLVELDYIGNYFLTNKDSNSWYSADNYCFLVYRYVARETMETEEEGTIVEDVTGYYYVRFENLMTESNGVGAVNISNYATPNNRFEVKTDHVKSSGWWTSYYEYYYYGYEKLDGLYNDVVTANLENFNHEDNVSE